MTKYTKDPTATNRGGHNMDKWIALRLMQHVEQVYSIAEMLSTAMEDLSDQMANLESELENLSDMTDELQEKIDGVADLIREKINQSPDISEIVASSLPEDLPL